MSAELSERARQNLAAIDRIREAHRAAWRERRPGATPWPGDAGAELPDIVPCCGRRDDNE